MTTILPFGTQFSATSNNASNRAKLQSLNKRDIHFGQAQKPLQSARDAVMFAGQSGVQGGAIKLDEKTARENVNTYLNPVDENRRVSYKPSSGRGGTWTVEPTVDGLHFKKIIYTFQDQREFQEKIEITLPDETRAVWEGTTSRKKWGREQKSVFSDLRTTLEEVIIAPLKASMKEKYDIDLPSGTQPFHNNTVWIFGSEGQAFFGDLLDRFIDPAHPEAYSIKYIDYDLLYPALKSRTTSQEGWEISPLDSNSPVKKIQQVFFKNQDGGSYTVTMKDGEQIVMNRPQEWDTKFNQANRVLCEQMAEEKMYPSASEHGLQLPGQVQITGKD